jgi:excisionase family DNA binding protein
MDELVMPFLSHQVRPCRFLTRTTFFLRAFMIASFENSNSYSLALRWHMACCFSNLLGAPNMKKPETSIRLLTLAEAASILKISKRTLHRMIQNRQIPAFKVGGQWRILESRFQEWVQEEENTTPKVG